MSGTAIDLRGVLVPAVTPFDPVTGDADLVAMRSNVRRWADEGVSGIVVGGSTGEAVLLDDDERTRLVAFTHCSNIVGHINPVAEISALAHDVGATTVVDGVSAAPHGLPDVDALDADIYLFSTYKTYGPHQGVMVVRDRIADQLTNQSHWFNAESPHKRLVPAGPDHAQVAACNGVVDCSACVNNTGPCRGSFCATDSTCWSDRVPSFARTAAVMHNKSSRSSRLLYSC